MDNSIYDLAVQSQNGDEEAFAAIAAHFRPMIQKRGWALEGEDTCQDLTIFLWELIAKLPPHEKAFQDDKVLFSYIAKSLQRRFIRLSIAHSKRRAAEMELTPGFVFPDTRDFVADLCLLDSLNDLIPAERKMINWIYRCGHSPNEIAAFLHVTRQAVNQLKKRALKKLNRMYLKD